MTVEIRAGDCRDVLATLPAASVRCCVTSPPYFGLRDYGVPGQIGLEQTPAEYIAALVEVFREVRRVLADDGTVWLVIGDSYSSGSSGDRSLGDPNDSRAGGAANWKARARPVSGKPKNLLMIPARVALALQADGWWLRSSIVWHKPNPMPESVRDRPTSAHESVFLLAKAERYYYDAKAIAEPGIMKPQRRLARQERRAGGHAVEAWKEPRLLRDVPGPDGDGTRNARNVWTIATQSYAGAHCAVMPPALAERCIRAGSAVGDTILDPFLGAGTTGLVADRLGRNCIGIELNPASAAEARARIGLMAACEAAD